MALPLSYHWRSLFVRKTTTVLTVLVIAAVVGVFTWMIGFAGALRRSMSVADDAGKILVLKRGATSESNSAIPVDEFNRLTQLTDVARDESSGEALVSPEMMVQVSLPRLRDRGITWGNVAVRGVTEKAFRVHRNVRPLGAVFKPGSREVIVGRAATKQFGGLQIGDRIQLGYGSDREYTVVGHFFADGGPAESEIWAYLPSLMDAYSRTLYSSGALRLRDGADADAVIGHIEGPSIQLQARTERAYWSEQSRTIEIYLMLSYVLVAVMSLAAVFSIANTMFAAIAGRTREIAMLRTIGYSGSQIMIGFIIESIFLALLGGVVGCLGCLAWLELIGNTKDMFGATTFTTLAFEINLHVATVLCALATVAIVGVAGALIPAYRAAKIEVISALREP
ncbi:MAG: FtsX-like permease family protein [Planctomycetota bacterium]